MSSSSFRNKYRPQIEQLEDRTNPSSLFVGPGQALLQPPPQADVVLARNAHVPIELPTASNPVVTAPQIDVRKTCDQLFGEEESRRLPVLRQRPKPPLSSDLQRKDAVAYVNNKNLLDDTLRKGASIEDIEYLDAIREWLQGRGTSAIDDHVDIFVYR